MARPRQFLGGLYTEQWQCSSIRIGLVARICRSQSLKHDQFRQGRGSIPRFGIIVLLFWGIADSQYHTIGYGLQPRSIRRKIHPFLVESFDCEDVVDEQMVDLAKARCAAVSEVSESINVFLSVGSRRSLIWSSKTVVWLKQEGNVELVSNVGRYYPTLSIDSSYGLASEWSYRSYSRRCRGKEKERKANTTREKGKRRRRRFANAHEDPAEEAHRQITPEDHRHRL
jgi:hypothetical protein